LHGQSNNFPRALAFSVCGEAGAFVDCDSDVCQSLDAVYAGKRQPVLFSEALMVKILQ
jgi:hypothetical protein